MLEAYLARHTPDPNIEFSIENAQFQTFTAGWTAGRHSLIAYQISEFAKNERSAEAILRDDFTGAQATAFDSRVGMPGASQLVQFRDAEALFTEGWSNGVTDLRGQQLAELVAGWQAEYLILGQPMAAEGEESEHAVGAIDRIT